MKMKLVVLLFLSHIISHSANNLINQHDINYDKVYNDIKSATYSIVYRKGSIGYNKRKITQNGLCSNISPDLIVVPKSTRDVANIVKISRWYNIPLSVRSGGHSYICANIKNEGIQIDLRKLKKVELTSRQQFKPPGPALLLGPGQTWGRVLKIIPPDRYTLIHGACLDVGVGGYLIGGGAQASGTTQRLGFGNFNVLQFTMVDGNGNIIKVSESNLTTINPETGVEQTSKDEHNLFRSLQFSGSSFGVVTEFHYRIFPGPELLPAYALVYIDGPLDLFNFQNAALDGRYSMTIYFAYFFTPLNLLSKELIGPSVLRILMKILPIIRIQRKRPIATVIMVDNYPSLYEKRTNKNYAYRFLKKYRIKLVSEGKITDALQLPEGNIGNYETIYRTSQERKNLGPRPFVSANFFNLTNLSSMSKLLLQHPLFGFKNIDSRLSARSECEFCWLAIVAINTKKIAELSTPIWSPSSFTTSDDVKPVDLGNFQIEISCQYKPNINSRCPKIIRRAKMLMRNSAIRNGEKLTQYWNTPTCDDSNDFRSRYWSQANYKMLLKAKEYWDPQNVFNHCQSIGSTEENCCPSDM